MNELDDKLLQVFAATRESLPPEDFLRRVALGVKKGRRKRAIRRTALTLAAVAVAGAATPYVAMASLAVANVLCSPITLLCPAALVAWGLRRVRRAP